MPLITKPESEHTGYGTTFGAATPPRTIGDVIGETGDMLPLHRGGMLVTAEDEPVIADTDGDPATAEPETENPEGV